jgi:hypothetical protein
MVRQWMPALPAARRIVVFIKMATAAHTVVLSFPSRADDMFIWGGSYHLRWGLDPNVTNLSVYWLHVDHRTCNTTLIVSIGTWARLA